MNTPTTTKPVKKMSEIAKGLLPKKDFWDSALWLLFLVYLAANVIGCAIQEEVNRAK